MSRLKLLLGDYNSESESEEAPNSAPVRQNNNTSETTTTGSPSPPIENAAVRSTSWTQCIDKASGHPYYWHTETKEVTWEIPAEYQAFLERNAELLADSNVANLWTVCYTEGSGSGEGETTAPQRYYVNEYTRIVSWDKPVAFVEPEISAYSHIANATGKTESPVSKNIIKRRRVVPKAKPKRENPYSKPSEEETIKIERISSFAEKSESSSEEENKSTDNNPLKLVATDYNSDTDHNASSALDKTTNKSNARKARSTSPDEGIAFAKPTKTKNTFASIITGGRSPQADVADVTDGSEITSECLVESAEQIAVHRNVDDDCSSVVKTQKRKRRIEFITKAPEKTAACNAKTTVEVVKCNAQQSNNINLYSSFTRSHVEFTNDKESNADSATIAKPSDSIASESTLTATVQNKAELAADVKETIEAKLKFLCEGRTEVSAVQAILIQLETLTEAFDEGALHSTYFNKWLDGIAMDLQTLEAGAAPADWKCLWNRTKSQYCYVHLRSGDIRWEYPSDEICDTAARNADTTKQKHSAEVAASKTAPSSPTPVAGNDAGLTPAGSRRGDDEMDICTTPPPNVECHKSSAAIGETLPPCTDAGQNISAQLASFYSDLATIETAAPSPPEEASTPIAAITAVNTTADTVEQTTANGADEAAKKKKRKIKKLQPWREGNLETWINKWAKAQQELDE